MYLVSKRMEIAGSHHLNLSYESKCKNLHGHNWVVTVFCGAKELNEDGMVIDFTHIKKAIHDKLDHQNLNDIVIFNPSAENLAKWVCDTINLIIPSNGSMCYRVTIQESEGNIATYINPAAPVWMV